MAILASCWFLIESFLIPDGFEKWFYLSFYIHPIFLLFCQIFLWLKLLQKWVFIPISVFCKVVFCVFGFFKNCVIYLFCFTRWANTDVEESNDESFEIVQSCNQNQVVFNHYVFFSQVMVCYLQAAEDSYFKDVHGDTISFHDHEKIINEKPLLTNCEDDQEISCDDHHQNMEEQCPSEDTSANNLSSIGHSSCGSSAEDVRTFDEFSLSICSTNSPAEDSDTDYEHSSFLVGEDDDQDMNDYSHFVCSSMDSLHAEQAPNGRKEEDEDPFYNKYTEQMRWFDVLNYDRTYGISAILNKQVDDTLSPTYNNTFNPTDNWSATNVSWSKSDRKGILRSLESDFELVYVAQSCLSWEALHHQYGKVEALASASSQNGVFHNDVAREFQKFEVLLQRFMEDETSELEGKRVWNYVRARLSTKSLLQVPKLSEFWEEEKEENKEESISVGEVLRAIERCMQTFWVYVKTDNKRPWWKLGNSLWTFPPVEDPRDLKLIADLTKKLQKKKIWLKDSKQKQKCWIRKVASPRNRDQDCQKKETLFTMIDMKLASRVLQMSLVSSSQLKWCQQKLDNIVFEEGKVVRTSIASGPTLFPP